MYESFRENALDNDDSQSIGKFNLDLVICDWNPKILFGVNRKLTYSTRNTKERNIIPF